MVKILVSFSLWPIFRGHVSFREGMCYESPFLGHYFAGSNIIYGKKAHVLIANLMRSILKPLVGGVMSKKTMPGTYRKRTLHSLRVPSGSFP